LSALDHNIPTRFEKIHYIQHVPLPIGLIQQFEENMDLSRFEPEAIDAVKAATSRDDLVGLPYTRHFSALYYDKEIFDKFGVEYPKDGMTWEEIYTLAKKLTRNDGGVQYAGLSVTLDSSPRYSQLSLPYINPKTLKAQLTTDQWQKVLEFMAKIHKIPGNKQIAYHTQANDLFVKDRTLAMLASNNILFEGNIYKFPDLNWDMVTYPVWPEAPGKALRIDQHMLSITNTSKNKDAAFLVL
jgi:multiple sugar transport system substrate-binding protein